MDIYLFDQLQKGRFENVGSVLDVGCGEGRNLVWFLRHGIEVHGVDRSEAAIGRVRELAKSLQPNSPADRFLVGDLGESEWAEASMDAVVCCAVLHFSRSRVEFEHLLQQMWRGLRPGGVFFARLASDIGIENRVEYLNDRWAKLPDGTERFLVNEAMLLDVTERLGGEWLEPIKTTNVQNLRCMTTWCLRKIE
jgi:SAM-dependent methyltransferase